MTGAWTLTDEGEFILNEPYKTKLAEAKHVASVAWQEAIYTYLAEETGYDVGYICETFMKKAMRDGTIPTDVVDEFVIQALEGNL